jgi:hypothetical protein
MSNAHQEKYITKLLTGFVFITVAILVILYAAFERTRQDDWYFWGILASILTCTGLYFLLSSFVHKIKSDLIRRQKQRDQGKHVTSDHGL